MALYSYTISTVSVARLSLEIQTSSISVALDYINVLGSAVDIYFKASLSEAETTTLNGLVSAHSGLALPENEVRNVKIVEDATSSKDADGTVIIRNKIAKTGSALRIIPLELITGKYDGIVYAKDYTGTDRTYFTLKIYDANDALITSSGNENAAVKTVVDFEPTFNYEMISAKIHQQTIPSADIHVYGIVAPDLTVQQGGSKEMVGGLNLKYMDPSTPIDANGRASKPMTYSDTYHTNKIRAIFKYAATTQHNIQLVMEYYA